MPVTSPIRSCLLRYFGGRRREIRQAISVIKKRTGQHERAIRELRFNKGHRGR